MRLHPSNARADECDDDDITGGGPGGGGSGGGGGDGDCMPGAVGTLTVPGRKGIQPPTTSNGAPCECLSDSEYSSYSFTFQVPESDPNSVWGWYAGPSGATGHYVVQLPPDHTGVEVNRGGSVSMSVEFEGDLPDCYEIEIAASARVYSFLAIHEYELIGLTNGFGDPIDSSFAPQDWSVFGLHRFPLRTGTVFTVAMFAGVFVPAGSNDVAFQFDITVALVPLS